MKNWRAPDSWQKITTIDAHTAGYERLCEAAGGVDIQEAARVTGIPTEHSMALAAKLGAIRPAAIDRREGVIHQTNGTQINRALARNNLSLEQIEPTAIERLVKEFEYADADALWADIGLGNRIATLVARRLLPETQEPPTEPAAAADPGKHDRPLAIQGTEGMVVTYGRCCFPIPGDRIYGFLSSGRGIVIHRAGCRNIADYRRRPDRWVPVDWAPQHSGEYTCRVQLQAVERRGVLAKVAAVIAEHDANIVNVKFDERDGRSTLITFDLGVRDRHHLADVIRSLRNRSVVMRVRRANH